MKALKRKMEKATLQKAERAVAEADMAAQRERNEQVLANLTALTAQAVQEFTGLQRLQKGPDANPDEPMLIGSLMQLVRFLLENGVLKGGPKTDALLNAGIPAIADGALAGKAAATEKRIITLG